MPRKTSRSTPTTWRSAIVQYISEHPDRPMKARGLARALAVPDAEYVRFRALVRQLLEDGTLALGRGRALAVPGSREGLVGVFRTARRGGFVGIPTKPDLYVSPPDMGSARDGDRVLVRLLPQRGRVPSTRAEIVRVIERNPILWVGELEQVGALWLVRPRGRGEFPVVYIDDPTAKSARPGDLVAVEPIESTLDTGAVRGVIVERLGEPSETQTRILAVVRRNSIPHEFPADVRQAAARAAANFREAEFTKREDLRALLTVTIDPPDARDFDDAISLEPLPHGKVRLGVHIADVAHFVPPDSLLDREARLRGNSVYFPGYVVPMLPETLSNGVCSLQPQQPRLTQSVFLTCDGDGRVSDVRAVRGVIESRARLTYEQVTAILSGGKNGLPPDICDLLARAEQLAQKMRERRLHDGMIVLNLPEAEIRLDDSGRVVDAGPADTSFSHTIIEMFMVAANEAVCRLLKQAGLPQLRRIHPDPEPDSLTALNQLLGLMGLRPIRVTDRRTMQSLLAAMHGRPEEPVVNLALLRSLAQATYSTAPVGHFALASEDYCHFTSPIRRYPDLINHRMLDVLLSGRPRGGRKRPVSPPSDLDLDELARHTSFTERRAQDAEREARAWLLLELMKERLGEVLEGLITGVASFGVFVQVKPFLAEGLIHRSEFGRDSWSYDRQRSIYFNERTRRMIHIGQRVRVRVAAVDELRQEVALVPAADTELGTARPGAAASKSARPRKHVLGNASSFSKRKKKRGHQGPH